MNNIKVKTRFDFPALKTANMYVLRVKRKSYIVNAVIALLCIAGAVYTLITQPEIKEKIIFSVLFGFFALFSIYNIIFEEKKVERSLKKFYATNAPMTQYVSLSEEKIVIVVPNGDKLEKISYDWAFVQEINVLKNYILMFLNGGVPVIINRSDDSIIEGSQEELFKLIEEKGSLKPYRIYDKEILKDSSDPINYVEAQEPALEDVIEELNKVEEEKKEEQKEESVQKIEEKQEETQEEEQEETQEEQEEIKEEKKEE